MINLYRHDDCSTCADVEDELKEMVLAHNVITVGSAEDAPIEADSLPAIEEDDTIVTGAAAIESYLQKLKRDVYEWRTFQGDACYIDQDGNVC